MATKFAPQVIEEIVGPYGWNYRFDLDFKDITETTVSTSQTFDIVLPPRAGDKILHVGLFLDTEFQDTTYTAQNTNTVAVGDSGDTDMFIVAIEANANGSVGTFPAVDTGDALPYTVPATPLKLQLVFGNTSGKIVSHINKGHLHVLFAIEKTPAPLT
jgi:hypothetical protein